MHHDPPHAPYIEFDYTKYAHLLDDPEIAEEDKRTLLETLFSILIEFVDLGFGVHPVQESCGQSGAIASAPPDDADGVIDCSSQPQKNRFKRAAAPPADETREGAAP